MTSQDSNAKLKAFFNPDKVVDENEVPKAKGTFVTASGPSLSALSRTISAGKDLEVLKRADAGMIVELGNIEERAAVRFTSENAQTTVIPLNLPRGQATRQAKKILVYTISKIIEQCLDKDGNLLKAPSENGLVLKDSVRFTATDLVKAGLFANVSNARRGFLSVVAELLRMELGGHLKKGELIYHTVLGTATEKGSYCMKPFIGYVATDGFTILLNPKMDWRFLVPFRAYAASWIYKLSDNAFSLGMLIFQQLRQRSSELKKNGKIKITFEALRIAMALPDPSVKRPSEHVKRPFLSALDDFSHRLKAEHDNDLRLEIFADTKAKTVKEFIETGYIDVYATGDYMEASKEIAEKISNK